MDEDGESSEEDEHRATPMASSHREPSPISSSTGGGSHAADSSPASPMPFVGAEPRSEASSVGHDDGEKQGTADGSTMTRASEGTGRHEAGHRSRLQQGARASKERVAKLWSKLRAVAYIASLQVRKDVCT